MGPLLKNGDVGFRSEGSGGLSLVMEISYPVQVVLHEHVTLD